MNKLRLQDLCNCYMYLCSSKEDMKDYEERLLQKCFDECAPPMCPLSNSINVDQNHLTSDYHTLQTTR
jgi:predicted DNA-binding ArsR family transcriptional regulator